MKSITSRINNLSITPKVPDYDKKLSIPSSLKCMPHQSRALQFIEEQEQKGDTKGMPINGGMLCLEPGLGKTFVMLHRIAQEINTGVRPTLVVCPLSAMITWENEPKKFFGEHMKVCVFRKERMKLDKVTIAQLNEYHIVIVNFELLRSVVTKNNLFDFISNTDDGGRVLGCNTSNTAIGRQQEGESILFSIKWRRIIIDESHNIANRRSGIFQSVMCLSSDVKWCLTGTPIRNWSEDLYAQFKFLGYTDNVYDIKAFKRKKYKDYMLVMDYDSANIQLPKNTIINIKCELTGQNKDIYLRYLEKASDAFNDFIVGTKPFSEILTLFMRLRQVCVAPYIVTPDQNKMTNEEKEEYTLSQEEMGDMSQGLSRWINEPIGSAGIYSPKCMEIIRILKKDIPKGEKVIIFTMFKRVIELIQTTLEAEEINSIAITGEVTGKEREKEIQSFKKGDVDVLLISYKIGAESLNLTEANHIILVEPFWSPAVINQAVARVNRIGQTKETKVYQLYVPNTKDIPSIEEGIIEMCNDKLKEANATLEGKKILYESANMNADTLFKLIQRAKLNGIK